MGEDITQNLLRRGNHFCKRAKPSPTPLGRVHGLERIGVVGDLIKEPADGGHLLPEFLLDHLSECGDSRFHGLRFHSLGSGFKPGPGRLAFAAEVVEVAVESLALLRPEGQVSCARCMQVAYDLPTKKTVSNN